MKAAVSTKALASRDRLIVLVSATVLIVLAWLALIGHQEGHIASPHMQPFGFSAFALSVGMWMVMMVAMMLPPVLPWILFFAEANREHASPSRLVVVFVSGYFIVWLLYSVAAGSLQLTLQQAAVIGGADLRVGGITGGVVLVGAGLFQLTPLKRACLKHCRTPLSFFLSRWRDGPTGAFRMGLLHGAYCAGCCWALMVLSFALGVMNLLWMATLTLMICVEKLVPRGDRMSLVFGVLLLAWGLWLAVSPAGSWPT